jgi:trehalose utilization protein
MTDALRVTVWNEFIHERRDAEVKAIYPDGIHAVVGAALERELGAAVRVRFATLDEPGHGLSDEVLESTDVLTWWGHWAHDDVADEVVDRVTARVLRGMGLVVLHSAHFSKIFRKLMGTSCRLRWRNADDRELVWTVNPAHPIAAGVPVPIVIPKQEMYGEFFDIPAPDELVFVSSFSGGEVFRSGCCFYRGRGRIFYFSPGDQEYPVYHQPEIGRVIANGVRWAAPVSPVADERYAPEYCGQGWFENASETAHA